MAERFLELHLPRPAIRNEIQDILWVDTAAPEIPKKFRREVARALADDLYVDSRRFDDLLERLWITNDDPLAFFDEATPFVRKSIGMFIVTQETGRPRICSTDLEHSVLQIADLPCSSKDSLPRRCARMKRPNAASYRL